MPDDGKPAETTRAGGVEVRINPTLWRLDRVELPVGDSMMTFTHDEPVTVTAAQYEKLSEYKERQGESELQLVVKA